MIVFRFAKLSQDSYMLFQDTGDVCFQDFLFAPHVKPKVNFDFLILSLTFISKPNQTSSSMNTSLIDFVTHIPCYFGLCQLLSLTADVLQTQQNIFK